MDPSLFVNREEAEAFTCQICHLIAKDPILEHDCSKKFCRSCYDSPAGKALTDCTHCQIPLRGKMKVLSPLIRDRILLKLSMQCPLEDCREIYQLSQHTTHLATCGALPVQCSYCDARMPSKSLSVHQQTTCPLYPISCPVPGCPCTEIPRCQMEDHENDNLREHNALLMTNLKANEANKADVTLLRGEQLLQLLLQLGTGNQSWPYFYNRRCVRDKINQLDEFGPKDEEGCISSIVQKMSDDILAVLIRKESIDSSDRASKRARHQTDYDDEYKSVYVFKPNNQTLRVAVRMWCSPTTRSTALAVYGHISTWDTSCVTNMSTLFQQYKNFNDDINAWDVSNVEDMSWMFHEASAFNQPLNSWQTGNVTTMFNMFYCASSFNQPIGNWDIGKVTDVNAMFHSASSFNQPLNSWDMRNVEYMNHIFFKCIEFNQPLDSWKFGKVTSLDAIFCGACKFNQPLNTWNISHITSLSATFSSASSFNQPLDKWDVSNVREMGSMYNGASSFDQPLDSWDLRNVQSTMWMFEGATSFSHMFAMKAKWPQLF